MLKVNMLSKDKFENTSYVQKWRVVENLRFIVDSIFSVMNFKTACLSSEIGAATNTHFIHISTRVYWILIKTR